VAVHAAFAEELARLQNRDHGFLALFGQDSELDLTFLNVEDRVGDVALLEYVLIFNELSTAFPSPTLARKTFGSNASLAATMRIPFGVFVSTF
jgi:hypothetical protein